MARVLISTQGWGVLQDQAGNSVSGYSVTLKNRDGTNATHYSARTGGTSSTAAITSSVYGTLDRWVEEGEYLLEVGADTYDVDAASGSTKAKLRRNVADYGGVPDTGADMTAAFVAASGPFITTVVPAGEYRIDEFALPAGASIEGDSNGTTLKAATGAAYAMKIAATTGVRVSSVVFDGNAKASKGLVIEGGTGSSQRHYLDHCTFRNATIGCEVPEAAPTNQADKNIYLGCHFHDNDIGLKDTSNNGQNQTFIGGSFDGNATEAIHMSAGATVTCIGTQFQSNDRGIYFGTTGGGSESLTLIDCIFETSNPTGADIDGTDGWPASGVSLHHCVLQADPDTVIVKGGGVLRSYGCRFNNGDVRSAGSDSVFYDEFSTFGFGAAYSPFDTTCRRFKVVADGVELTGNAGATVFTVARGRMQLAGGNANMGAVSAIFPYSQAVDLPSQSANSTSEVNVGAATISLSVGDLPVVIGAPSLEHGLTVTGLPVTTANNLRLRVSNHTGGAIDAASRTFYFLIVRF